MEPAGSAEDRLQRAVKEARHAWETAVDPVSAARAAARCFRDIEGAEAAFWRGSYLTQGYMSASVETPLVTADVRELRQDGVDELRRAVRGAGDPLAARARYLLGKVDHLDRFGVGLTVSVGAALP